MNQQSHDAQKIIDAFNAEVEKAIIGKESSEEIVDAINSCNRKWLYALFPTAQPFAMEALLLGLGRFLENPQDGYSQQLRAEFLHLQIAFRLLLLTGSSSL